jgi:hypothetical protein
MSLKFKSQRERRPRFTREDIIITVSYRRVRGVMRQVYNIRLAPLETDRFRFGLPLGKTLSKERAERYGDQVAEYIGAWLEGPR